MSNSKAELITEMQEELFLKQGQGWFRIISGSMRPLVDVNDRVLAERAEHADIQPGDIILFKNSGALVTHRVVKKKYENGQLFFLQKGDWGGAAVMISAESVLGKIVAIEKNGTVLRLDQGSGKILDTFLGIRNRMGYRVNTKIGAIKERLRGKLGFQCLKLIYRSVKWPFSLFNKAMVKIVRIV